LNSEQDYDYEDPAGSGRRAQFALALVNHQRVTQKVLDIEVQFLKFKVFMALGA
jgi:hypothetical protein